MRIYIQLMLFCNKKNSKGVWSYHATLKDNTSKYLIKVTYAENELRDELFKLEKYIVLTEERKHYLSTNNNCEKPDDEEQKLLNDLYLQNKKEILIYYICLLFKIKVIYLLF